MNQQSYVKAVKKRLTCSTTRRDEFVRDLESDIASALGAGENWEQVEQRMGEPLLVAQEFNEDLPQEEIAAWKKRKRLKIVGIIAGIVVVLGIILTLATLWVLPQTGATGERAGVTEQEVIAQAQKVAEAVGENDYATLRPLISDAAAGVLTEPVVAEAHGLFGDNWGALESFGNTYTAEIAQMGMVGEAVNMVVTYENATVTFDLVFDEDLKITSLYLR